MNTLSKIMDELTKLNHSQAQQMEKTEWMWDRTLAEEIIKNTKLGPSELADKVGAADPDLILKRLRQSKLSKIRWRQNYIKRASALSKLMIEDTSTDSLSKFIEKSGYFRKYNTTNLTAKIFWLSAVNELKEHVEAEFVHRCQDATSYVTRSTIADLLYLYENLLKTGELRTGFDIQKFRYRIAQLSFQISAEINRDSEEAANCQDLVDDKNYLLSVMGEELEGINDDVVDLVDYVRRQVSTEFFLDMNSPKFGHLLDTFYGITQTMLSTKTEDNEVRNFIMLFMKFLYNSGLEPISTIGSKQKLSVDLLKKYEFRGVIHDHEKNKNVEFVTPGWKIKNQMIIKPIVREVKAK